MRKHCRRNTDVRRKRIVLFRTAGIFKLPFKEAGNIYLERNGDYVGTTSLNGIHIRGVEPNSEIFGNFQENMITIALEDNQVVVHFKSLVNIHESVNVRRQKREVNKASL